jgi:hypothetical protein
MQMNPIFKAFRFAFRLQVTSPLNPLRPLTQSTYVAIVTRPNGVHIVMQLGLSPFYCASVIGAVVSLYSVRRNLIAEGAVHQFHSDVRH